MFRDVIKVIYINFFVLYSLYCIKYFLNRLFFSIFICRVLYLIVLFIKDYVFFENNYLLC